MPHVTREPARPATSFNDDLCDDCTLGCGNLWRLRTSRGRLKPGKWCDACIFEREALS